MKRRITLLLTIITTFFSTDIFPQAPEIEWQNTIGGNAFDFLSSVIQTTDGGYLLGGSSDSDISGDKMDTLIGSHDYWIVKLDASGNTMWQNTMGGNTYDQLNTVIQTTDGGFLLGGYSLSGISGHKTEASLGFDDYWVVKLDASGNMTWQNTVGGSGFDQLNSVIQTTDGGYLLGGESNSGISGDKSEANLGLDDYWIVKLDESGNIIWQNTIGGNDDDYVHSIIQTSDGGYLLGGYSLSGISGDKTEASLGGFDYWIVKLDASGNINWQNTIGGSGHEGMYSVSQTIDGGYLLAGYGSSGISGDKTEANLGLDDFWIVKVDGSGNIIWQNNIGGSGNDWLFSVIHTTDGGYLLGGWSDSGISGDKTEASFGSFDYWMVKLDASGNITWQNTLGGSDREDLRSVIQTTDGGYLLGGNSYSGISGDKTEPNTGYSWTPDYWIIKTKAEQGTSIPEFFNDELQFSIFPNPTRGKLTIQVSTAQQESLSIKLFDMVGKEVAASEEEDIIGAFTTILNLSNLPTSIYLLKVQTTFSVLTQAIIVQ